MLTHLGSMPVEQFLQDYWQKKPLLIRQGVATPPQVDGNELAGFALEDEIESRLLVETPCPTGNPLNSAWQLHHGPLPEALFAQLPDSHWTLLVQAVDQLLPQIQNLKHLFRFIPNWRIDDVMVSYATDGGGVGPHFDYYDVFLVQAQGQREWQLGQHCDSHSPLRQDTDCKILAEFECSERWLVEPGDILYIPPGVAHWGVARGECTTYSVGFRAPSHAEMLLDFAQELASTWSADQRFSDANLATRENPGEITEAELNDIKQWFHSILDDEATLSDWFGRYMTYPKRQSLTYEADAPLSISPAARFAYRRDKSTPLQAKLYANGQVFNCTLELAQYLSSSLNILTSELERFSDPQDLATIAELLQLEIILEC